MPILASLSKKIFKRAAWWASFIVSPLTIFRMTGILVNRTISFTECSPIFFHPEAQGIQDDSKPKTIGGNQVWTVTQPSDLVMSHVLMIKGGIADCLGNVFDPLTGKIISGATHKYRYKLKRAHIPQPRRIFPDVKSISEEVAVVTASNQHIYWHWLLDVLPRLIMLDELGKWPSTLYVQKRLPFQHETLDYMRIPPKLRIIDCDTLPMISASTLLVPCHQIMEGREFPHWVYEGLRKKFLPFLKKSHAGLSPRIYISRAGSSQRRISNEEFLLPLLQKYGFRVVRLEELTFGEQMGVFREAEVVVAPNGSGLANLVFCSKGTTVIEIFPYVSQALTSIDFTFNFDYNYRLARSLELKYYYVCGSPGETSTSHAGDYSLLSEDLEKMFDLANV